MKCHVFVGRRLRSAASQAADSVLLTERFVLALSQRRLSGVRVRALGSGDRVRVTDKQ